MNLRELWYNSGCWLSMTNRKLFGHIFMSMLRWFWYAIWFFFVSIEWILYALDIINASSRIENQIKKTVRCTKLGLLTFLILQCDRSDNDQLRSFEVRNWSLEISLVHLFRTNLNVYQWIAGQWNANYKSKASFQWKAKQVLGMRTDCKPQNATTLQGV